MPDSKSIPEQPQPQVMLAADGVTKDFHVNKGGASSLKEYITHPSRMFNKEQESFRALDDVSLEVREGEFFGIVGRNGSGKSTILKILAGIYKPSAGRVRTKGKIVPFIELGVGFNNELSGKDNIYLNGAMLGFTKTEINAIYDEIVEFAELEEFMEQKLKNFSSGMRVRLAFSIAIKAEADVLLIDEVLAVGDAAFKKKCFEHFDYLKKSGTTVVFVSHDMNAIRSYCTRAVLINESKAIFEGSAHDVAEEYLKLFVDPSKVQKKKTATGDYRWGNGNAKVLKVEQTFKDNEKKIAITTTVKAKNSIDSPIVGFSIKTGSGKQILGTNTIREGVTLKPLKKGEKRNITWVIDNFLNDGLHYIDSTIADGEAGNVEDRWPDAASFRVGKTGENPYLVRPDFEIIVEEEKP